VTRLQRHATENSVIHSY